MTLLYIVLVLALLSGLLVLASIGIHRGRLKAETARKIVHAGMGGICLCFPLLFKSPEPVTLEPIPSPLEFMAAGCGQVRKKTWKANLPSMSQIRVL